MSKFIRVTELAQKDDLLINTDSISWLHEASGTVVFNGVHGQESGLMYFDPENMKKIIDACQGGQESE